jgi:hypothetical protein
MTRCVIAALVLLAVPAAAQIDVPLHANEIGIYLAENPDGGSALALTCYTGPVSPFTAYVVLYRPEDPALDRPVTTVAGYEFRINADPAVTLIANLPPHILNIVMPPEFVCYWDPMGPAPNGLPVINGRCTLLSMSLFTIEAAEVRLGPVTSQPTTIPGEMSYRDADDPFAQIVAHPVSGDHDAPVFGIYDCSGVIPNEDASWGEMKALFR